MAQLDVVQQRREQEQQVLQQLELLERQDELLELLLEQQRLAWPRWHRRNRQRQ